MERIKGRIINAKSRVGVFGGDTGETKYFFRQNVLYMQKKKFWEKVR